MRGILPTKSFSPNDVNYIYWNLTPFGHQDFKEKGTYEAINTQFFRFFNPTGMTPAEEKVWQDHPEKLTNFFMTGHADSDAQAAAREQAEKTQSQSN